LVRGRRLAIKFALWCCVKSWLQRVIRCLASLDSLLWPRRYSLGAGSALYFTTTTMFALTIHDPTVTSSEILLDIHEIFEGVAAIRRALWQILPHGFLQNSTTVRRGVRSYLSGELPGANSFGGCTLHEARSAETARTCCTSKNTRGLLRQKTIFKRFQSRAAAH
jgi:hypothetical protein